MRDFNQDIQIKKFELNKKDYSYDQLRNRILSNFAYLTLFLHDSPENYDKLIITFRVFTGEVNKSVEIKITSTSTFNNTLKLTFSELIDIAKRSVFIVNETLISKLLEHNISISHPVLNNVLHKGMMGLNHSEVISLELSDYYDAAYRND